MVGIMPADRPPRIENMNDGGKDSGLRKSEAWLRTIFEESPVGILTANESGLITRINKSFLNITGSQNNVEGIDGKVNLFQFDRVEMAGIVDQIRNMYQGGEAFSVETQLLSRFGKQVFIKFSAVALRGADDRMTGCILYAEDISKHREAEAAEQKAKRALDALQAAGLAIHSTLELDGVLDCILAEIGCVIQYDWADVALIRGDELVLAVCAGLEMEGQEGVPCIGYRYAFEGPDRQVVERRRLFNLSDFGGKYAGHFPHPCDHTCSMLMIPLFSRDQAIGILHLGRLQMDHFTTEDENLAETFSELISLTLDNSNLASAARRRIMEKSILNEITRSVSSGLEFKELLKLADKQLDLLMDIQFLLIASYEEDSDTWQVVYQKEKGLAQGNPLNDRYRSSEGISSHVISTREPLLFNKAEEVNAFIRETGRKSLFYLPKSMMSTPLIASGKVIGFMSAHDYDQDYDYSQADFDLFCLVGSQIALAFEKACLCEKINQLTITDLLTGLYTRRHFLSLAETEVQRVSRYQKDLSLIMIDFDQFKRVNDIYGEEVGDQVLLTFGKRMREAMRPMDIAGRYGGEEFVVLLPETSDKNAALVAERLRKIVANTEIVTEDSNLRVTISLGVAMINSQHATLESLLDHADGALFEAKRAGKNRVRVYSP
jgi:diguanylate cyclase (GGDEF)-like protein/PAS domain S-box-containing protein